MSGRASNKDKFKKGMHKFLSLVTPELGKASGKKYHFGGLGAPLCGGRAETTCGTPTDAGFDAPLAL